MRSHLETPDRFGANRRSAALSAVAFVDTVGARLAVFEEGTAGDTIVLLHGGPGVPDYLADVSAILATEHRVLRFDQRGTGQSTCHSGQYSLDDYVEDVDAVRHTYGLERLLLLGHSWGGTVAQLYATRHPDRVAKLCLCNSGIGLGDDWRAMERAVMAHNRRRSGLGGFMLLGLDQALALLSGATGDRAARRMMARVWRNYFDPPESAPAPSQEWLAGVHSRPIFGTRRAALAADANDLRGLGSVPVLIIFGEHDIYGRTTERLVARFPNARVVIIPHAGHIPWLQNRTEFVAAIGAFFEADKAA
jgi:proline iminopeptidase